MPDKKPVDRRTVKTKKMIRRALAELLQEKELRKITVQEIADKAEVSRFTFYKHYIDVYDLYDKIERELLIDISVIVLQIENKTTEEFFQKLVQYIYDNSVTFGMIFNPNSKSNLRDKLSKLIEGMFKKLYSDKLRIQMDNKELAYICCYRSQGCLSVIQRWVINGLEEPCDYIVKSLSAIDKCIEQFFSDKAMRR
jgi:AcrR family transcriptional regulator